MSQRVPDYQTGQTIPGTVYRVHRVLGQGGMGTVYEVEDTSVGKRYVLKTLHGDLADRPDLAARLAREARALAKLQHPNIVEVYTSGTTRDARGLPYYVMERLTGQSLRQVLEKKGRLITEQATDIAIDLLDALDHAHEFGIIHRDVKPDNIFLTRNRDGRPCAKLLDFGIIKLAAAAGSATMQTGGRFIGTFRYAPPEQILARDVTPQSDLYAAGLVLYEMLAGRGPFDDFTGEMEIGKAHVDVAPPQLSRFANVSPAIEQLVMSALQKDPAQRPRDAFSFASALRDMKKLATGPRLENRSHSPTVEHLALQPVSAARRAEPFGAEPSRADIVSPSGPVTRIDAPAGMNAPTANAQRVTHTVSLGVLPLGEAPAATFAAAPITMAVAEAPRIVDRRAETHEAVPQATPRPNYDTAPIPLSVFAPKPASAPPRAPQSETFGPHTTEASQRRKNARGLFLWALAGMFGIVALGAFGVVMWRQHRSSASVSGPTQHLAADIPLASASVAAPEAVSTKVPDTIPSDLPTASAPQAVVTTRLPAVTTRTVTTTVSAPPTQTVTPPPSSATPTTHRRVGSGL